MFFNNSAREFSKLRNYVSYRKRWNFVREERQPNSSAPSRELRRWTRTENMKVVGVATSEHRSIGASEHLRTSQSIWDQPRSGFASPANKDRERIGIGFSGNWDSSALLKGGEEKTEHHHAMSFWKQEEEDDKVNWATDWSEKRVSLFLLGGGCAGSFNHVCSQHRWSSPVSNSFDLFSSSSSRWVLKTWES